MIYVSAGKACQQALWMKQAPADYGVRLDDIPIMYDNKGAIDLSKNHVQHSRTKHIEIRHYFLRYNVQKGNISIEKIFATMVGYRERRCGASLNEGANGVFIPKRDLEARIPVGPGVLWDLLALAIVSSLCISRAVADAISNQLLDGS
ncbi:hypothetical protein Tco_1070290 [Tanacetum coccineum]|uniref:Copia protein n=1 Tax=Tanacetum coccineum TaxID=301880 RepID=A0ABQ5HL15_9ASTR